MLVGGHSMADNKLIIKAGMTGFMDDNPNNPRTVEEIVSEAIACIDEGASVIHLHSRDEKGKDSAETELLIKTIHEIRANREVNIEVALNKQYDFFREASGKYIDSSVTLGGLFQIFGQAMGHDLAEMKKDMNFFQERKMSYEVSFFDLQPLDVFFKQDEARRLLQNYHISLYFNYPGGMKVEDFNQAIAMIPKEIPWFVSEFNRTKESIFKSAIEAGGNVKLGFEDSPYNLNGSIAKNNAEVVKEVVGLAKSLDRDIASVQDARKMLYTRM